MRHRLSRITRQQLVGLAVLLLLYAIVMGLVWFLPHPTPSAPSQEALDSVQLISSYSQHTWHNQPALVLQYFDPNTADSVTLRQLGLRDWQVRNLLKYRRAGGRFRRTQDLQRLYGLTDSAYQSLAPYVRIDSTRFASSRRDTTHRDTLRRDSLYPRYVSHKRDTIIELNTTDTAELQLIRWIGPYTAECIIRYREQLGGYYSVEQLRELEHMDATPWDSILPHLTANPRCVKRIAVNTCSVRRLQRHPYLSFEQAKAIYERRRMRYQLHSIDDLRDLPNLNPTDLQRIAPYLSFSTDPTTSPP